MKIFNLFPKVWPIKSIAISTSKFFDFSIICESVHVLTSKNLLNDFDEVLADDIVEEPVIKRNIIIKKSNNEIKLDKTVCKFLIMTTPMPEVYGLYCKGNTGSTDKHSYASVPDMEVSNFLNMLFKDNTDNITKIYVECKYHKIFKKWIPYKITDSMDSLETINKIKIMLDSE